MSDTRERILEAAATAFAANGFRSSTVHTIAHAAKVNDITVFRYFPKKTDLYWEAIDRGVRQSEYWERLDEAIQEAQDPSDLVRRLALQLFQILEVDPTLARLLHFAVLELDGERKRLIELHFAPLFTKLVDCVRIWKASGKIRNVDPTNATWAIVAVLLAPVCFRTVLGDIDNRTCTPDEVASQFADICDSGLAIHSS